MTMANVIKQHGRPTLVLSHNKTLAAQLYGELKSFFPHNAVEYFISYYDYYQPEAYVPTTDTYIEKDASINEDIDRLRLRATSSLMEREDVIIVATVSAIYGLGDPVSYREQMVTLHEGPEDRARRHSARRSCASSTAATTSSFERGTFRVRGDTVEIFPAYEEQGVRVEMWGNEIERISKINVLTGETIATLERAAIYPAKHFVTQRPTLERAVKLIRAELDGSTRRAAQRRQAARGAAARVAHELRHRDDARDRNVRGHRELLAASRRARGGRAAGVSVRLLPGRLPRRRRRVARHAAADRRHVQRRPRAQAHARRIRLPSSERARQPAADVRRVPCAHAARASSCRRRRRSSSCACRKASSSNRSFGRRA